MPSRPVSWSIFCKSPSRISTLVLPRWRATAVAAVAAEATVAVAVIVEAAVVAAVAVVAVASLPPTPLPLAVPVGKRGSRPGAWTSLADFARHRF